MNKRIAVITIRVNAYVPAHWGDADVASVRSQLAHFDLRGAAYDAARSAVPNRDVELHITRHDRQPEVV